MREPHHDYECPNCDEWIEVFNSTPENFDCPWCGDPLRFNADAEFVDGMWRDRSTLTSKKQEHMKKMLAFAMEKQDDPA